MGTPKGAVHLMEMPGQQDRNDEPLEVTVDKETVPESNCGTEQRASAVLLPTKFVYMQGCRTTLLMCDNLKTA